MSSFWRCESGTLPAFLSWLQNPFPPGRHTLFLLQAQPSRAASMSRDLPGLGRGDLVQHRSSLFDLSCSVSQLVALMAEEHHISS